MAFRTFTRTWWRDKACTKPGAGRRSYAASTRHETADGARAACRSYNTMRFGASQRGPRGLCMEFEEI
jgi:hypothetical protein